MISAPVPLSVGYRLVWKNVPATDSLRRLDKRDLLRGRRSSYFSYCALQWRELHHYGLRITHDIEHFHGHTPNDEGRIQGLETQKSSKIFLDKRVLMS